MFVGHYSAALLAKALEPRVPVWVLLLAAQLVDVAWALLVLAGVERVRLDAGLASNPLALDYMPYTHSLVATGFWAFGAGLVVARVPLLGGTRRAGIFAAGVVASHWFLDLLVHRPDLTLWGAPPKLGLGLWDMPIPAYLLELALLAGSASLYAARGRFASQGQWGVTIFVGGLALLQTSVAFGPIPASVPSLLLSVLVVFGAVAYAGSRMERRAAFPGARR